MSRRARQGRCPGRLPQSTPPSNVDTLLEALPYIREFHGRTVVIKYGGAAMREESLREDFATDVVLLKYVGLNPVIVHGGGPEITEYMERLGLEVRFHEGLRVSDAETVEVARMVLLGKLNSDIVQRLNRARPAGGRPLRRGRLAVRGGPGPQRRAGRLRRLDRARRRRRAQPHRRRLHPGDRLFGIGLASGQPYNVNADEAAGKVAAALGAHKAIFLTDVKGWLADPEDEGSLSPARRSTRSKQKLAGIDGGMRPKLQACVDAIQGGAQSAHIIDGRKPHSLLLELFTDAGIGTMVTP